jgi:hypothetical protein
MIMARLPVSGVAISSPRREEGGLRRALSDLGLADVFNDNAVHEIYLQLGEIIGRWMSEQQRLEVSPVARALLSMAKNLGEVSVLLGGLETGIHSGLEITVASRTAEYLAMDPTVGSLEKARELVSAFQQDAARMAHVCMVARADLPDRPGERGRPALDWYDDFAVCAHHLRRRAESAWSAAGHVCASANDKKSAGAGDFCRCDSFLTVAHLGE